VYFLLLSAESLEYFVAYRYFAYPTDLLTIARTANSLLAAGTVSLCIASGGRLYGRTGGYLAGLILAIMPRHARFAHLAITHRYHAVVWTGTVAIGQCIIQSL
jgi:uncharacterized membrane protein